MSDGNGNYHIFTLAEAIEETTSFYISCSRCNGHYDLPPNSNQPKALYDAGWRSVGEGAVCPRCLKEETVGESL